jgi:predicted TPR repeat methyltransferase
MPDRFDVGRLEAARTAADLSNEYDRIADSYDSVLIDEHQWRAPEIIAGIAAWLLPRSARILDAACGTGLVGASLKRFGFTDVHGLDMSRGMLAVSERKQAYRTLANAALGGPLPYRSGEFDAVTISGAFTPNHAPPESLNELVRATRPGGYVIFSLRSDEPPRGFAAAIGALTASGRWVLFKQGAEFQSMPLVEPRVRTRLHVYEIADAHSKK